MIERIYKNMDSHCNQSRLLLRSHCTYREELNVDQKQRIKKKWLLVLQKCASTEGRPHHAQDLQASRENRETIELKLRIDYK